MHNRQTNSWTVHVAAGGPASLCGIQPGDRIAEMNGESVKDKPCAFVEERLVGGQGDTVRLTMLRGGHSFSATVALDRLRDWEDGERNARTT